MNRYSRFTQSQACLFVHHAGTSIDSDKCDRSQDSKIGILMVVYEKIFLTNFKCFKELRKCVAKIILWKNVR